MPNAPADPTRARGIARTILAGTLVAGLMLLLTGEPIARATAPRTPTAAHRATPPAPHPAARPAPEAVSIRRILPIDGPLRYGEWHWNEVGAPVTGPIVVTVDLAARVLSVFRDGYEIGTTAVIYGADEKPTPLGIFPVTQKDAHHRSSIYGGAPMPYMLRMTNDGVSIHGSEVTPDLMTHGCIGVPIGFAKRLFAIVKLQDPVIVTRGQSLDLGQPITAA